MAELSLNTEFQNLIKQALSQDNQEQVEKMTTPENCNKSAKSPDFFQHNNAIKMKFSIKLYRTTIIKSTKFLSNFLCVCINNEDFYNQNFVFDIYGLINKNLNPFRWEENCVN